MLEINIITTFISNYPISFILKMSSVGTLIFIIKKKIYSNHIFYVQYKNASYRFINIIIIPLERKIFFQISSYIYDSKLTKLSLLKVFNTKSILPKCLFSNLHSVSTCVYAKLTILWHIRYYYIKLLQLWFVLLFLSLINHDHVNCPMMICDIFGHSIKINH